jgi:hypothetical protein
VARRSTSYDFFRNLLGSGKGPLLNFQKTLLAFSTHE